MYKWKDVTENQTKKTHFQTRANPRSCRGSPASTRSRTRSAGPARTSASSARRATRRPRSCLPRASGWRAPSSRMCSRAVSTRACGTPSAPASAAHASAAARAAWARSTTQRGRGVQGAYGPPYKRSYQTCGAASASPRPPSQARLRAPPPRAHCHCASRAGAHSRCWRAQSAEHRVRVRIPLPESHRLGGRSQARSSREGDRETFTACQWRRPGSRLGARQPARAAAATEASGGALLSSPSHCSHCSENPPHRTALLLSFLSQAPSFLLPDLRRTAPVLAISAVLAALALASSTTTTPRSRLPTWSTRALSATAPTRDAPTPDSKSWATPAPAPDPKPEPEPMPKPDLKTVVRRAARAARAPRDPLLFAPLRRPRFPVFLCHGEPYGPGHPCAELSAQDVCRAVRVRRARAGRVPENAGALLEERPRDPAQHCRRGGVRYVCPSVRVPLSVHFSSADAVSTGLRQSSSARRSSNAPSSRAYTAAA
jgi:hypothetical protein